MPPRIEAVAFFEKIENRMFGSVLLSACDEDTQCFRIDFFGVRKTHGLEPRTNKGRLGQVAPVNQSAHAGNPAFADQAHGSTLLRISETCWKKKNHPRNQLGMP